MLPKKKSGGRNSDVKEAIDMIDNIINVNDKFEKSLKEDDGAIPKLKEDKGEDLPSKLPITEQEQEEEEGEPITKDKKGEEKIEEGGEQVEKEEEEKPDVPPSSKPSAAPSSPQSSL